MVPKLSDFKEIKLKKKEKDSEHRLGGLESHNRVMNGWMNSTISKFSS
jgi:hypothetical protein